MRMPEPTSGSIPDLLLPRSRPQVRMAVLAPVTVVTVAFRHEAEPANHPRVAPAAASCRRLAKPSESPEGAAAARPGKARLPHRPRGPAGAFGGYRVYRREGGCSLGQAGEVCAMTTPPRLPNVSRVPEQ